MKDNESYLKSSILGILLNFEFPRRQDGLKRLINMHPPCFLVLPDNLCVSASSADTFFLTRKITTDELRFTQIMLSFFPKFVSLPLPASLVCPIICVYPRHLRTHPHSRLSVYSRFLSSPFYFSSAL